MKRFLRLPLLMIGLFSLSLEFATGAPMASRDKLANVPGQMQTFVNNGTIAGAVTLIGRREGIVSVEAVGWSDLAARKPMKAGNLFWIASMTKPMTAVAVLMLQDEGRLSVNDPVETHLPEFKGQWMIESKAADRMALVRPPRAVTLRDLLTHTSGLGDVPAPRPHSSLAELITAYSQQPLRFPPGSKWEYSNAGINTLGRIVEVVSGMKFEDFLQRRLLTPLGMKDTTFWPTPSQAKRVAKAYKPGTGGNALEETSIYFIQGPLTDRARTPFPAGGLFSTAHDVGRFYQMMLNEATLNGRRYLTVDAVQQMTQTQTDGIKTGFVDGMSFGFGFAVVKEPTGITAVLSPGTFGHGGAYATQSWADPAKDLVLVLMIQRAGFPNGDNSPVRRSFQEAAVRAMAP